MNKINEIAPKTSLIIITGLPGTGKTTLGKKLAEEFTAVYLQRRHQGASF